MKLLISGKNFILLDEPTALLDQKSQLSASHICWLANSIGYKTSINIRNDNQNIYRMKQ